MSLFVDLQLAVADSPTIPTQQQFTQWVCATLQQQQRACAEVTIRIVTPDESQMLNHQYRHKNAPTNVLSFPFELPAGFPLELSLLGDIIICKDVVEREAQQQQKTVTAHWAHLTIHGCLHLLGFDHIEETEAQQMESLETAVMLELGYADPYLTES